MLICIKEKEFIHLPLTVLQNKNDNACSVPISCTICIHFISKVEQQKGNCIKIILQVFCQLTRMTHILSDVNKDHDCIFTELCICVCYFPLLHLFQIWSCDSCT